MELKDFVAETLKEILLGVAEAQKLPEHGKNVVPTGTGHAKYPSDSNAVNDLSCAYTVVKFDVAVTAENEDSVKAGGGIKIAVVSLGAGGETISKNSSVTRIQFSVPVRLAGAKASPSA